MCTPCSLPLDLPLEVVDPLCPVAFLFVGCIVILKLLYREKIIIKEMLGKMPYGVTAEYLPTHKLDPKNVVGLKIEALKKWLCGHMAMKVHSVMAYRA